MEESSIIWGTSRALEKDGHQQKDGKFGLRSPKVKSMVKTVQGQRGSNGCEVSIFGDIQNLTGHDFQQSAPVHSALSMKLDAVIFRGPF